MGMDAKATIFYGCKLALGLDEDTLPEGLTLINDEYIAVEDSVENFDWDYGLQQIFPQQMYALEERNGYYSLLKNFLSDPIVDFAQEDIGWFVLCDYS